MPPKKRNRPAKVNRALIVIVVVAVAIVAAAVIFAPRATLPDGSQGPQNSQGSRDDEYAREADRHYIAGLAAYRQQDWRRAVMNFRASLSYEPDHLNSQEHLNLARSEERVQQTLTRARAAFEAGRAEEAVALLTTVPESSVYADQVAELRREIQAGQADN